eukprot:1336595-Pyramimonas_sp.AAC.1
MGSIEVDAGMPVSLGQVDIADAFHALALPSELVKFFGMRRLAAGDAGVTECEGAPVGPDEMVVPCFAAVPMG